MIISKLIERELPKIEKISRDSDHPGLRCIVEFLNASIDKKSISTKIPLRLRFDSDDDKNSMVIEFSSLFQLASDIPIIRIDHQTTFITKECETEIHKLILETINDSRLNIASYVPGIDPMAVLPPETISSIARKFDLSNGFGLN